MDATADDGVTLWWERVGDGGDEYTLATMAGDIARLTVAHLAP